MRHWFLVPMLLAMVIVPGFLGGATLTGRLSTMLAVALAGLLACWYWRRRTGLVAARLGRWRFVALALVLPVIYGGVQALQGPMSVPAPGASWGQAGPFGGMLSPSTILFHTVSLASLLLAGLLAFLAAADRKEARFILGLALGSVTAWSAVGAAAYFAGYEFSHIFEAIDRPTYRFLSGPFVNRGHFGSFAGAGAVLAAALFAERLHHDRKRFLEARAEGGSGGFGVALETALLAVIIVLLMVVVLETAARGALVAVGGGLGLVAVIFALRGRGRERVTRLTFLAAAMVAVLPVLWLVAGDNLAKRLPYTGVLPDFSEERVEIWKPGVAALEVRPLTGWGLGTYGDVARIYGAKSRGQRVLRAHNEYLDLAVGWGVPAALAWIGGIAYLGWACARASLRRRRDWAIPLAGGALTLHFALHSIVDFPLYIPANALLFALVLGAGVAQSVGSSEREARRNAAPVGERRKGAAKPGTQFV